MIIDMMPFKPLIKCFMEEKAVNWGMVNPLSPIRLTEMGTTFINTYCQAAGCAPSRTSMHAGRYPFSFWGL